MALGKDYDGQDCSIARTLELVGERWTLLIVRDAFHGVSRFNDFRVHLGIPRAVLAARLQSLVDVGVLARHAYQENPVRHAYQLTQRGLDLWPIILSFVRWGDRHLSPTGIRRLFSHATCGTDLGEVGNCPACGVALVPPGDVVVRYGPGATGPAPDPVSRVLSRPHRLLTPIAPEAVAAEEEALRRSEERDTESVAAGDKGGIPNVPSGGR